MSESGFESIWEHIVALEGEEFHLKRGGTLTYRVHGDVLVSSRTEYQLAKSNFAKAWARMPLEGPGEIDDLRGPSYVWAILTDPRVSG